MFFPRLNFPLLTRDVIKIFIITSFKRREDTIKEVEFKVAQNAVTIHKTDTLNLEELAKIMCNYQLDFSVITLAIK